MLYLNSLHIFLITMNDFGINKEPHIVVDHIMERILGIASCS